MGRERRKSYYAATSIGVTSVEAISRVRHPLERLRCRQCRSNGCQMSPQLMSRVELAPRDVASNGETPGYWRPPDQRWARGGSAAVGAWVTYLDRPAGSVDGVL